MTGFPAIGLAVRAQREANVEGMAVKPFGAMQIVSLVNHALDNKTDGFLYQAPVL
jgi:hypothetical protein